MSFWFVGFMLFYLKFHLETIQVSSHPLGCSHNGTTYSEGEGIPTEEPCLSCVCRKGALACTLRVCGEPPEDLPPGCFVVLRPGLCCPEVLCEEGFVQNGVELRTGSKSENKLVENGCYINGSVYAEGSALASSQVCEYCYCIHGLMKCIKPKCYQPFEGCKPIHQDTSCCPTHYDCRDLVVNVSTDPIDYGCQMNGIYYQDGDMVPSQNGSSCESCYCMKSKIECAPVVCSTDFFDNCQPILAPDQCCPTSFSCGTTPNKDVLNSSSTTQTSANEELFNENNYTTLEPDYSTKTDEKTDEVEDVRTTIETTTTEISTLATEIETTTSVFLWKAEINVADNSTFLSLQTGSQNSSSKTAALVMEETTLEPTTTSTTPTLVTVDQKKDIYDVEVETKLEFADQRAASLPLPDYGDDLRNVSSTPDDYDSYDYSEPKLPPSLPNLVIFPFVAADAVVKEETSPEPDVYNSANIKRIDTQGIYYKDYFSPPAQTEGGFVPKESSVAFYENSYFKAGQKLSGGSGLITHITPPPQSNIDKCYTKERIYQHGEITSAPGDCTVCTCFQGSIMCEEIVCPPVPPGCQRNLLDQSSCCGTIICEPTLPEVTESKEKSKATPHPLDEVTSVSFLSESPPFHLNPQTSKPVTVTYKNIVVDYYPDFQITSTRTTIKNKNEDSEKNIVPVVIPTEGSSLISEESATVSRFNNVKTPPAVIKPVPTKKPTVITTTSETSFFDEFLKSFLSEEKETPRPVKHKYSSKIKATTTTGKPIQEEDTSYSFLHLLLSPDLTSTTTTSRTTTTSPETTTYEHLIDKQIKKEEIIKNSLESGVTETPLEDSEEILKKPNNEVEESQQRHSNLGILKLAGCNIYGRMYRVGKIIFELSGPCLECVCTDLGVQCKPLSC